MAGEALEKKLYDVASKGDVTTLVQLLEKDPYLVHGFSFPCSRNLLHVATMHGQASIVEKVLNLNPRLARIPDSQESSPLHIAAAEGHVKIASKLLAVAPEMCLWRDKQGMNPVHVAAMNGHVEILQLLLLEGCTPAMERLRRGQTVLHLCVKYAQLRVLKVLVEKLGDLVCTKDDDGDTLLHLAVRCNQLEIVRYLVENKAVKQHTQNGMGKTALQILNESPPTTINYLEMKMLLTNLTDIPLLEIIPEMTNTTMVVVVLIATMAFQSVVSPPGGVWEDDGKYANSTHRAGEAVMASTHPDAYLNLVRANTTAFVCSVVTMYLFTTGMLAHHPSLIFVAMGAMWAALLAIVISYAASVDVITPDKIMLSKGNKAMAVVMTVFFIFGVISMCGVGVRNLYRSWLSKKRRQLDLAADTFPLPFFYWIFQQLETRNVLRFFSTWRLRFW